MNKKETTQENLNKLIEFRHAIYTFGMSKRRDALFEAWDALTLKGMNSSFPYLSLSGVFRRKWHSLYKALEQGELQANWLTSYLAQQVPHEGVCHFSLDGTGWPRARARTMEDRQYLYLPTPAVNGGSTCGGGGGVYLKKSRGS